MPHNQGYLSEFFDGVSVKKLSAVEAHPDRSNQHEFNGVEALKKLMGETRQEKMQTRFLWADDEEEKRLNADGYLTWYDARENHPTRSEYRLYFPTNTALSQAKAGDLVFICRCKDKKMLVIVCPQNSSMEVQLLWLFGLENPSGTFENSSLSDYKNIELGYAVRTILDEIGIVVESARDDLLEIILKRFGDTGFPSTALFSNFARETANNVFPLDDPDHALVSWMDHEEKLFRSLEKHFLAERLNRGFMNSDGPDVDGFVSFSLSVQNRRKSRVGHALENHLEAIFQTHNMKYERNAITENRSRPDFIFPSAKDYHNSSFPSESLAMLGVKTTCKDRWRQVLAEATRIKTKHLFTLEPGISEFQTNEMEEKKLQLVIPKGLHETYQPRQKKWLMNLNSFISEINGRV